MKNELSRRPSLLIAAALVLGLAAMEAPVLSLVLLPLIGLARSVGWRLAVALMFGLGLWMAPDWAPRVSEPEMFVGSVVVQGTPRLSQRGQSCEVLSDRGRFLLYAPRTPILSSGDMLQVRGELGPMRESMLDVGAWRQISGVLRPEPGGIRVVDEGAKTFELGVGWRGSFVDFMEEKLPHSASAVNALCFNVTGDLDPQTMESLQRTGTIHIISASGLHVMIFAAGVSFTIGLLPIPRGYRLAMIGAVLAVYAIGAGLKPPVVRAVAMSAILGMATVFRREPDLLSALSIAVIGFLLWQPVAVYDIGFQFSAVTVAALGMFLSLPDELPTSALHRVGRLFLEGGRASLVATLASAPLAAYYFGLVSIVSIPANVLIILALPAITLTAFVAHPLSVVWPALSQGLLVLLVEPLTGWILWVAESFGNLPFAAVSTPAFSAWWLIPFYALLLMMWRPRAYPAR